jgi:beta-N-acetylhexosaminidase
LKISGSIMASKFAPGSNLDSFGQFFIVGLTGVTLDDTDRYMLETLKPAGILLLKRNFDHASPYPVWQEKLHALIEDTKKCTGRDRLIVSLDHEGGTVMRTPPPITRFPFASRFASSAYEVGCAMAAEIRALGVNLSWAPVADIHSNPANPIIGERAFGTDPDTVSARAIEYARALRDCGVLGCAKHFPGHGDTSSDSHLELPYLNLTEADLKRRELAPFKALSDFGIPFFMTAHIMFPKIDPDAPATLSRKILRGMLREEIGYKGIIIADDLGMKAVSESFRQPATIAKAFKAGCDMFIVSRYPDPERDTTATDVAGHIRNCLSSGLLTEADMKDSFERIENVLQNLPADRTEKIPEETFARHRELCSRFC